MYIDPRTLLSVLTLSTFFLAFFLAFYRVTRKTYPGFRMWVRATVLMAVGGAFLAARGVIPEPVSVLAGNTAYPAGAVFLLIGTRRFLGLPSPGKTVWAIPVLTFLGLVFFYWGHPMPAARGLVMSAGLAWPSLLSAWLMCRHAADENRPLYWFTAFMLAAANIALPVRSLLWLLFVPEAGLLSSHFSQTLYLLVAIFAMIGWTFGFLMMNNERMEAELHQSQARVARANKDLTKALNEVRQLGKLLPICSHCKKIRDSQDHWHRLEDYISNNSETEFSHGICPECASDLYPELDLYRNSNGRSA